MGLSKMKKTEGGSGGKRGHSNMEHWETTGEIKTNCRRKRREQGKMEIRQVLSEKANG
jgi:hypothetical protein